MCVAALAWQMHPRWPLVLASNRDEFSARASQPLHRWATPGGHPILAGRDAEAGGTWLAVDTARGRLALVTNLRTHEPAVPGSPSRGSLPLAWLDERPLPAARHWNLLTADWGDAPHGTAALHSSALTAPLALAPGITTVSNGVPPALWPKQRRLAGFVRAALAAPDVPTLTARVLAALADRLRPPPASWPHTGFGPEAEAWLSPIHVTSPDGRYRTRCATVVVVERGADGALTCHLTERRWRAHGQGWDDTVVRQPSGGAAPA